MESPDSEPALDSRQMCVKDFLIHQTDQVSQIGFERWLHDSLNRITEPRRGVLAEKTASMFDELKITLSGIANGLPAISTSRGTVESSSASLYLKQELLREQRRDEIARWLSSYESHRRNIADIMRSEHSFPLAERTVCTDTIQELGEPLSDLKSEENVHRACLILGRIQRARRLIRLNFLTAPLNSIQSTGITVVSSAVLMGHWFGGIAGIGTTGCHYFYEYLQSKKKNDSLALPERNCLRAIRDGLNLHRGMILYFLSEAGIQTDPESLLERLHDSEADSSSSK